MYNNFGIVTLTNSTVSGNSASFAGGGVWNRRGIATLTNSTVSGNSALRGGGVFNTYRGSATLTNSTVSGNSAGVGNDGTATLTDSTVSGNGSGGGGYGGGVLNGSNGTTTLARTLVSGNGNTATMGAEVRNGRTVTAANFNLFGHSGLTNAQAFEGFTPGASDITATAAPDGTMPTALADILAPLANNGGPTQTHALVASSPAIDAAGPGCPPPTTDQRGVTVSRPQGTACDIGSFEAVPADLSVAKTDDPDPVLVSDQLTWTITVANSGTSDATGVDLTDTLPASGFTFVSSISSQGGCSPPASGVIDCDLGNLANGTSATVTIKVTPTAEGTLSNTVEVLGKEFDDHLDNNTATQTTTVNAPSGPLCFGQPATIGGGTQGNDTLIGTLGNDVIVGLGGNDRIDGGGGNDTICGNEGNDRISGSAGNDTLSGDEGNDALGGANDNDQLDGGPGNDALGGGNGPDILFGREGNDALFGEDGNDTLDGGPNADVVRGGSGFDTCRNRSGDNVAQCEAL